MNDSYEHYAEHLLDQVFQNVKKTHPIDPTPPSVFILDDQPPDLPNTASKPDPLAPEPAPASLEPFTPTKASIRPTLPEKKTRAFLRDTLSKKMKRKKQFGSVQRTVLSEPSTSHTSHMKKPVKKGPSDRSNAEQRPIERQPSFWKPREEGGIGWRGKKMTSSVKKPKRPMAFKTPRRKPVRAEPVSSVSEKNTAVPFETIPVTSPHPSSPPVYVMQQPPLMMAPSINNAGYYLVPSHIMLPQTQLQPQLKTQPQQVRQEKPVARKRKVTVQNPRENSNDKCMIM
ncbi:hypothetical protein G6F37_001405 [Rhizopus arrhizus]|nr:hypothetical protein G6F38_001020 [Rhizopus arrhizus]KAG1163241.1 hypothetical protein G6F37_001405 [Rhizopus arrhizus]